MARILIKLSKIAEEALSDGATAFSGSVPECMAAALREYFVFSPSPSTAAMIRLGLSPAAADEYVYVEFALRSPVGLSGPSRGGGLVVVKCRSAVVSFAGGPSGSVGSTAGPCSCSASSSAGPCSCSAAASSAGPCCSAAYSGSASSSSAAYSGSAGGSFLGGVGFSTERCDPIVAGSSTLVVKSPSSSCRCSSDIGSFAGGSLLHQRPASCSTDRGGFPSRIFAGADYTTDCSAAYSGSVGSYLLGGVGGSSTAPSSMTSPTRRFPMASPIAVSSSLGSSLFSKRSYSSLGFSGAAGLSGGGSLVRRRLASYCTKPDGAADCGGCPRRIFLKNPSGNEEKLYKMIEEIHVAQGRDYYDLKRTCLKLSEELNESKATHREAMIAARHQVGVTAFRLFLAVGGFCGFFLRDLIQYTRDVRTGAPLPVAVVSGSPPTTAPPAAATTTAPPAAATTTPSPAVST